MKREELILKLQQTIGMFWSVKTRTVPKMRKTDNPYFGRVIKEQWYIRALFNEKYQEKVNKLLVREGIEPTFQAKPLTWGVPIGRGIRMWDVDGDKNRVYINIMPYKIEDVKYFLIETGEEIPESELKPFLPKQSKPVHGAELIYKTVNIENIIEIRAWGEHSSIED